MSDNKVEIVVLEVAKSDISGKDKTGVEKRSFELPQAEKILQLEKKLGKPRHKLAADSPYTFTKDGAIIKKSNK